MDASTRKIRWRTRRGLLENDLIFERFFSSRSNSLTNDEKKALKLLLVLGDNDLLDLLLGRTEPIGNLNTPEVLALLKTLRSV